MRFLYLFLALAFGSPVAFAQTMPYWENAGVITTPPVIDAYGFLNRGQFYATNGFLTDPYQTYNTINFTNRGYMVSNPGFRFLTVPSQLGQAVPAQNFINENGGEILTLGRLEVLADNIVNRGTLSASTAGRILLKGESVNLRNSTIGAGSFGGYQYGDFDRYWAFEESGNPGTFTDSFFSVPNHGVTNFLAGGAYEASVIGGLTSLIEPYVRQTAVDEDGLTNIYQVVYVVPPLDTRLTNLVSFGRMLDPNDPSGDPIDPFPGRFVPVQIEWRATVIEPVTGADQEVSLLFQDTFPWNTNVSLIPQFPSGPTNPQNRPSYRPSNFSLLRNGRISADYYEVPDVLPESPLPGRAPASQVIRYSAWGGTISANSVRRDTNLVEAASVTNMPGRVEIEAADLNLNATQIVAENFLSIKSTNHFSGNRNAYILAPVVELDLASTNQYLVIDELIRSELPMIVGDIRAYSVSWKRITSAGDDTFENNFAVLVVDASELRLAHPAIHRLHLRADHLIINDQIEIEQNFKMEAYSLTVSNEGHLNILSERIAWSGSMPYLTSLTNYGQISSVTALNFTHSDDPNNPVGTPYDWFVNRGTINPAGLTVSANNLVHSGLIDAWFGDVDLAFDQGEFSEGLIYSAGHLSLAGNHLTLLNTTNFADRIVLSINGTLTDNGDNEWRTRYGIDLLKRPSSGDLYGTTVFVNAPPGAEAQIRWDGEDRGNSSSGFLNNGALKSLFLNGGFNSLFYFTSPGGQKALYVENLVLSESIENDYFFAFDVDPSITIYFRNLFSYIEDPFTGEIFVGPSLLDPNTFVEDVPGFKLVNNFKVPVSLRDSQGNVIGSIEVDSTLRESATIDSDGDGIPNKDDDFPFDGPVLTTTVTEEGAVRVSWNAAANTTYTLWCTHDFVTWTKVTDVVSGAANGPLSVELPASSQVCTYKVSYSP